MGNEICTKLSIIVSAPEFGRLYRTGDFGILNKGVILYAGRTDSQIKIRGHRVDLLEVERAVSAVQDVEKAVVLCYGLSLGNPEILAFVTVQPDARIAASHIEASLKNTLTYYMIPQVSFYSPFQSWIDLYLNSLTTQWTKRTEKISRSKTSAC